MAIDTRTKRARAINFGVPFLMALPTIDTLIDAGDRSHLAHSYMAAAEVPVEPSECIFDWSYFPLEVEESVLVYAKLPLPVATVINTDCKADWN